MLRKMLVALFALAATAAHADDDKFFLVCSGHINMPGWVSEVPEIDFLVDLRRRVITVPALGENDQHPWSITRIEASRIEFVMLDSEGSLKSEGSIDRLTGKLLWRDTHATGGHVCSAEYACARTEPRF
jgi:hypothetical protein